MPALHKRRLSDLWVTGREVTLDDGHGEPIRLWLQKLNSIEGAESARAADAARARKMAIKNKPGSDEYLAVSAAAMEYSDVDGVIDFLLMEERARLQIANESQLAAAEEWNKDNYLQGLRDSWIGGMQERWLGADPKEADPEANRVFTEMKRFDDEVNASVERDLEGPRERLVNTPLDELRTQMIDRLIALEASQAWLDEFYHHQLFFGVRDPDNHGERYFVGRSEVDELSTVTYGHLHRYFENLEVDVMEGKGSQEARTSSPSSEPPGEAETVPSPGLAGAAL